MCLCLHTQHFEMHKYITPFLDTIKTKRGVKLNSHKKVGKYNTMYSKCIIYVS